MKVQLIGPTTLLIVVFGMIIGSIFGVFNGILAIILSLLVASLLRKRFKSKELAQDASTQDAQTNAVPA